MLETNRFVNSVALAERKTGTPAPLPGDGGKGLKSGAKVPIVYLLFIFQQTMSNIWGITQKNGCLREIHGNHILRKER